jgi:hydrogenase nickel incorporation protein HypA/HybF
MHELSVTENLLNITLRHAQQAQARRVSDLYIVVGQLASIVDDSVQFYWDIVSKDTLAEGAKLHFNRIQSEFQCMDCSQIYSPPSGELLCPACSSAHLKVLHGEEFYLDAISIENNDASGEPS